MRTDTKKSQSEDGVLFMKYFLLWLRFATLRRRRIVLGYFATNRQSTPGMRVDCFVERDAELALCGSLPARKQ